MKISQKTVQYILLILIVVIALSAYEFGYVKFIEKARAGKKENDAINNRINILTEKETHRDEWNQTIAQSENDIKELLAKYGSGNTTEKSILFITELEEAAKMRVPSIAFNSDSIIYTSSDLNEEGDPSIQMNTTRLSISYNTSYDGLKKCMDFINEYSEYMHVSGFSAGYNQESGLLAGNMTIELYGVTDEDHVYIDPFIGGVDIGTENLFGATGELDSEEDIKEDAVVNTNTGEDTGNDNGENTGEDAGEDTGTNISEQ